MTVLIRDGLVLTPAGLQARDVVIDAGRVHGIGQQIDGSFDTVIDATGCLVGPGLVDIHTHLRDPGLLWKEDLASGSAAAAAGGFTAVVAMPNTDPPIDNSTVVEDVSRRGREVGLVEVSVSGALTRGRSGSEPADIEDLYRAGVRIFTDDGDCLEDAAILETLMRRIAVLPGAVLAQHAEASALTSGGHMHEGAVASRLGVGGLPPEAEEQIVSRDIALVRETGARYHCQHVSSAGTVDLLRRAKQDGLPVTAEVTPHHLTFDESHLEGLDPNFKMYPPLRRGEDRLALKSALVDGTIDVVATDHAPHATREKAVAFEAAPRGVIGLETAAAAVWAEVEEPDLLFDRLSMGPARIAGLERQGCRVEEGAPANIVVFDPNIDWVVEHFVSKSENSPYVGRQMRGRAIATLRDGVPVHLLERERL